MTVPRGTSNTNVRGSSTARRRRREWLVATFRADVDLYICEWTDGTTTTSSCPRGSGSTACRCYRCGDLLTTETVTVDRIIPGCQGGTYRRDNIRPACLHCNSEVGGALRSTQKLVSA